MFLVNKDNVVYNFRRELVYALLDRDYDVYICSPYGKKIDFLTEKGARFVPISLERRGKNPFKELQLLWHYFKMLKKYTPDVVLTYTTKCSIYGGFICGILGIPYIINNAGLLNNDSTLVGKLLRVFYSLAFKKASCMMYQNHEEKTFFNKLLKNKVPYKLLPGSGVNTEYFNYKPYPQNEGKIIINYVSRIEKDKGIEELLSCIEIVGKQYPQIMFRIFGDYDDVKYKKKIQIMEERGLLQYMGTLVDIRPCIEDSHAVIHPSYHEGMTNVTLEHGAMGRPALGSNVTGVKETIEDGVTGFVFEVRNVDSMVNTVIRFINIAYNEKESMGRAARQKMVSEFDRNIVTNAYLKEIGEILER